MIQWNKYFDRIFCVTYINNGRYKKLCKELDRVCILKSGIFEFMYNCEFRYKDQMYDAIYAPHVHPKYMVPCTIQHLKIWNIMRELGYERILILEDDVAFLKDLNEIERGLETADYKDITLFHYLWLKENIYYSTACYSINQWGAEVLIDNFNKNENFTVCDQLLFGKEYIEVTHVQNNIEFDDLVLKAYHKVKNYNTGKYELNTSDVIIASQHCKTMRISKDVNIDNEKEDKYNFWMEFNKD